MTTEARSETQPARARPARRRKLGFILAANGVALLVGLGAAEVWARAAGHEPWTPLQRHYTIEPGGKFYQPHPTLGYTHRPGRFTVTMETGFQFTATHLDNTLRITKPLERYADAAGLPDVWIFGCSLTHGWSLNDDETYPWLLQERFPKYDVVNFGVSGYGTVHSLVQLREALAEGRRPKLAVLAYSGVHDERNTFQRSRRKIVAGTNPVYGKQPFARLQPNGSLAITMTRVIYMPFPLMRQSAFMHLLEQKYDALEATRLRSREVSAGLINAFAADCREAGVPFVLAGIHDAGAVLDGFRRAGLRTVDISVDAADPANTNMPHDPHPSAYANRQFARRLGDYIELAGLLATAAAPPAN